MNPKNVEDIEKQLTEVVNKIKDSITRQKESDEQYAIKAVSTNPSYFFSYAKRFAKQTTTTGPLLEDGGHVTEAVLFCVQ